MAEGELLPATLTPKQAAFVREYLIDSNATQAAIRAGYSEATAKQQGSRLLTNADIVAAVQAGQREIEERAEHTREELEQRLWSIILGDLTDVVAWGPDGLTLTASADLSDAAAQSLRELRFEVTELEEPRDGDEPATVRQIKAVLKQHDPIRAAQLLAKMRGWLVERVEHSGTVGITLGRLHELAAAPDEEE